jgi:hypothetical protein
MRLWQFHLAWLVVCGLFAACQPSLAQDSGRLLATSGVSQIDGAAGGGLAPWAMITGYGTRDAVGGNLHATYVGLGDFGLTSAGASIGLYDRLELSYAHSWFDTREAGGRLGLGNGYTFNLDSFGAKLRLFGDVVYDQDTWMPELSVGAQVKAADSHAILHAIGARSPDGVDVYVAATKLFLAESLLLNATIRATKANQFGLLGFGGDRDRGYSAQFEGSAAVLLSKRLAIGVELRTKPDNLGFAKESTAYDVFAAYFLTKNVSLTAAFVALGPVALQGEQNGFYLSVQTGF